MATFLDLSEFPKILETPDASRRAGLAKRLFADFDANNLNPNEADVAVCVFRGIAHDDDVAVRHEFARFVASSVKVPQDIALALASDEAQRVATPFLRHGVALRDDYLVDVVGAGDKSSQCAIAGRINLSQPVIAALIEVGYQQAILQLLRNNSVTISSKGLVRLSERFSGDDEVANLMLAAPCVPSSFVEDRIHVISSRLKTFVDLTGWMAPDAADKAVANAVEHSLVEFSVGRSAEELASFFDKWNEEGRVTRGFGLRAACYGALPLLGFALGHGSGMPPRRVVALWTDKRGYGQQSLIAKAGYSEEESSFILACHERFAARELDKQSKLRPGHEWRTQVAAGIEAALQDTSLSDGFAKSLEGFAIDAGVSKTTTEPPEPDGDVSQAAA